jgi:hypothetical protein
MKHKTKIVLGKGLEPQAVGAALGMLLAPEKDLISEKEFRDQQAIGLSQPGRSWLLVKKNYKILLKATDLANDYSLKAEILQEE